ncbi:TPA: type VI secretion system lipoprotein TssJ [Klebsiella oxytoca]|uniref:Type VI secretion system lipoprotein TssJ n=1 Tax=Klebsiella oxytoca TaxID=571 RepID=A0AAN5REP0_KLEOX|nr:type VI secretion system lipoprotein TssJ [Klebsiella oxytoca]
MLRLALLCLVTAALSGCTAMGKMWDVAKNPDIQVGSNNDQPSTVSFSLVAEPDMNPNDSGDASPLEFQIVMLSEDSRLLAADFDEVSNDLKGALAKNYVDHQDYTLLPGQFKYLPPVKLAEKTRYIGVIAHYSDPDSTEWRKVMKVKNTGQTYQVLVNLRLDEIVLQQEEE